MYGEAEKMNQRALEGRERVLGKRHRDTLESLSNLAVYHWHHGNYTAAEKTMTRSKDSNTGLPKKG
jgi:hypothetical protein